MTERPATLRRPGLIALSIAVLGVGGFLLGACGGGETGAIATASGPSGTRPALTATRTTETVVPTEPTAPTLPVPTRPARTETEAAATTDETPIDVPTDTAGIIDEVTTEPEPEPPPSPEPPPPPPAITVILTQTEPPPPPPAATTSAETTPTETASETDNGAWGWVALAGAFLVALVLGLVLWRRSRAHAASWSAQLAELERRSLVALDDVLAQGSVVTGRTQALAAEARSLEGRAPDDAARADAARLSRGLNELAAALENDRVLRLATPPPGEEQLAYSTALIREQAARLQGTLRPPPTAEDWPSR